MSFGEFTNSWYFVAAYAVVIAILAVTAPGLRLWLWVEKRRSSGLQRPGILSSDQARLAPKTRKGSDG